jgi:hypothetical protein
MIYLHAVKMWRRVWRPLPPDCLSSGNTGMFTALCFLENLYKIRIIVFWGLISCGDINGHHYFRTDCCFSLRCSKIFAYIYVWHSEDRASWNILIKKKPTRCIISKLYFGKELYMFRTDLLSIIRSLSTVYTVTDICHASYVDCLLADSQRN